MTNITCYKSKQFLSCLNLALSGDKEGREQLYFYLFEEMKATAKFYLNKYKYVCNDESEYFFLIYTATELALKNYKTELGDFINFWHFLVKREKNRFIFRKFNESQRDFCKGIFFFSNVDFENNFKENLSFLDHGLERGALNIEELKVKEFSKAVFKYLESIGTKEDVVLIDMWMNSMHLLEISDKLKWEPNKVVSRLYYLLKKIKEKFKNKFIEFF